VRRQCETVLAVRGLVVERDEPRGEQIAIEELVVGGHPFDDRSQNRGGRRSAGGWHGLLMMMMKHTTQYSSVGGRKIVRTSQIDSVARETMYTSRF
jgi:hypothetical protein